MVSISSQSRWSCVRLILVVCSLSVVNVQAFGEIRALKLKLLNLLGYKLNPETILRSADAVCFDVDSTVFTTETVDDLTDFMNKSEAVKHQPLALALRQFSSFRKAMTERLNLLKPSIDDINQFIKEKPPKISPGVVDLIHCLQTNNVPVYLISNGFRSIILPKAKELNIPSENVFANRLMFYADGSFAGMDLREPTSENFGKTKVIENLKSKFNYRTVVMIGDGVMDLETCPPADICIGYGGIIVRPEVKSKADWYVTDFKEISDSYGKCQSGL